MRLWRTRGRALAVIAGFVVLVAVAALTGAGAQAAADRAPSTAVVAPRTSCGSLAGLDLSSVKTSVTAADVVSRAGHDYCAVTGYLSPQTEFEVLLPTSTWTGDYLQQGCGGFCGAVGLSLSDPSRTSGYQAPYGPLSSGQLVVAADDQGHETAVNSDSLWAREDPRLRVVFGYESEHDMARTARRLIQAFYGRPADHRYFDGVSDGGHEGLDLAQRYPADFDGIIAGAPAMNWADLAGMFEPWMAHVNTGRSGHQILAAEKLPALHTAVMRACADGSGVITDPRACTFRPQSIRCPSGTDQPTCLTPAQVAVVRSFYRGPTDRQGRNLFDGGMPYGSELAWLQWAVQPQADADAPTDTIATQLGVSYWRNAALWHNPPVTFGVRDIRFTTASERRLQAVGDIYNATDPDLRRFAAHGGRLIMYHGWADQGIPPFESLDYYRAVAQHSGGYARTQEFSRLYMIPGLYHCPCGQPADGDPATVVDMMTPLVRWVEERQAPATLTLPVTSSSGGTPPSSLSVAPTDPTRPAPAGNGLNSHYRYVARAAVYRPGNALWCVQDGPRLRCTRRR